VLLEVEGAWLRAVVNDERGSSVVVVLVPILRPRLVRGEVALCNRRHVLLLGRRQLRLRYAATAGGGGRGRAPFVFDLGLVEARLVLPESCVII
jgi:hypothetical protein